MESSTDKNGVTTYSDVGPLPSKIIYDDSGTPQGFIFLDETEIAFVRNLQGDVIAAVNQDGEVVMEYSYDPWGNIEYHLNEEYFSTEEEAKIFTALCPLTYRGYNYDFTTGLYYLQSRYYNPEWGRFLNCDDTSILLGTQGETHNANMFAYCSNNPINRVDYSGRDSTEIALTVVKIICILYILAPFYENNEEELYIATNKIKKQGLGKIKIRLDDDSFFNAVFSCFVIDEQITCYALAMIASEVFIKHNRREFLFSYSCMADEIKFHIYIYVRTLIYYDGIKYSYGMITPGPIDALLYYYLYTHSVGIDIIENDVYNETQAKTFDYYNGINDCYKYTVADPYMNNGVREKSNKIPKSRTDWQKHLMEIGGVK